MQLCQFKGSHITLGMKLNFQNFNIIIIKSNEYKLNVSNFLKNQNFENNIKSRMVKIWNRISRMPKPHGVFLVSAGYRLYDKILQICPIQNLTLLWLV